MRQAVVLLVAVIGAVLGYVVTVGLFLFVIRDNFPAVMFAIGPIGAVAGLFAAFRLVTSERGDTIRLVAALALAALIAEITPVMIAMGASLFTKPDDVGLAYALAFVPMVSVPGTIVLLLLGIWRHARSWWDGVVYGGASAAALLLSATLVPVLMRANFTVPSLTQATTAVIPGAVAGLLFFAVLRMCRVND